MRKVTSLTLIIAGFIEIVTSVILYIVPAGRVAYWADYKLFGLSKTEWGNIHITVGTLLLVVAFFHIYFNWRPLMAYLKNRTRKITLFTKSFNIALLISLYVTVGTLYSLPPMNYVLELGEYFSDTADQKYGEPPYGHAELSSLKMFCSKTNLDFEKAVGLLNEAGIKSKGPDEPIGELAKNNGISPQQLYDIIKSASNVQVIDVVAFPESPSPAFGSKTIKDICQIYALPLDKVVSALKKAGFALDEGDTVKEIGSNNGSNPMAIFEIIKNIAKGEG